MSGKVKTNYEKGSIAPLPYKRKVRLILWGGAADSSHNSTFDWARRNVVKSYKAQDENKFSLIDKRIFVAKDIVSHINNQEDDSIRSLDIWTHGGPQALYLTTADPPPPQTAPWYERLPYQARRWTFNNSSLYRSRARMLLNGAAWTEGSALLGDINFSKFVVNAKVELHGCETAATDADEDNIAANFSERLSTAGKSRAVVIGHAVKSNPNIRGGNESYAEQDYRHGIRVIFSNGKMAQKTTQKLHLDEKKLEGLTLNKN